MSTGILIAFTLTLCIALADHETGEAADHKPHALNPFVWLTNKHGATIFAIVIAGMIAALPAPGAEWTM